jgi:hypothetical protein
LGRASTTVPVILFGVAGAVLTSVINMAILQH